LALPDPRPGHPPAGMAVRPGHVLARPGLPVRRLPARLSCGGGRLLLGRGAALPAPRPAARTPAGAARPGRPRPPRPGSPRMSATTHERDARPRRAAYEPGSPPETFIVPLLRGHIEAAVRRHAAAARRVLDVGCGRQPFRPLLEGPDTAYVGL